MRLRASMSATEGWKAQKMINPPQETPSSPLCGALIRSDGIGISPTEAAFHVVIA